MHAPAPAHAEGEVPEARQGWWRRRGGGGGGCAAVAAAAVDAAQPRSAASGCRSPSPTTRALPPSCAAALLVEGLDAEPPESSCSAPTLGRKNSRTADSAPKEQEPDDERSDDAGLAEREAEPTDIARAQNKLWSKVRTELQMGQTVFLAEFGSRNG